MSEPSLVVSALTLLLSVAAGASGSAAAAGTGSTPADTAALRAALDKALADPAERVGMWIFTECFDQGEFRSVQVFGRGVGIWDGKRQFAVSPETVESILVVLREVGFSELDEVYGGVREPAAEPPTVPPTSGAALRLICGVTVTLGDVSKKVVQLDKGEQSKELARLAEEIFRICREPSRGGVRAADLADGIAKVASGKLAPETFRLVFHRKPEQGAGGFLLRIEGPIATTRDYDPVRGYGDPRRLTIGEGEFRTLVGELAALQPETLPGNLFALDYTDLSLGVLDRKKNVHAQQLAGIDRGTHGDRQRAFDLLADLAYNLHLRVTAAGSAVAQ